MSAFVTLLTRSAGPVIAIDVGSEAGHAAKCTADYATQRWGAYIDKERADGSGSYPAELMWRVLQPNLVRVLRQKGLPQEDINGVLRAARDSDRDKVSTFRLGKPVEEAVLAFVNYQEVVRDRLDLLPLVEESKHSVFP